MNDETMLVGCLMRSADAIAEARELADVTDLYDQRLSEIVRVVLYLDGKGVHDDPQAVVSRLSDLGSLERVGGSTAILDLWSAAPSSMSARFYARRVALATERRRARETLMQGLQVIEEWTGEEPGALNAHLTSSIEKAAPERREPGVSVADHFEEWYENLGKDVRHLATPWPSVNECLVGFRPGRFYVIGARPGHGKTMTGFQAAALMAEHGPVLYSSLEMGRDELTQRLVAMRAGVHLSNLERNVLSRTDKERVAGIMGEIYGTMSNLILLDESNHTVEQTLFAAQRVKRRRGLAALVVDYVQLLSVETRHKSRYEALSDITRRLKMAARELDVPVIALAQLNREVEGNRRAPVPADLRDSGSIEQDADVILLLQRTWDETMERFGDELHMHVAKNRQGKTDTVTLTWQGQYARAVEPEWSPAGRVREVEPPRPILKD